MSFNKYTESMFMYFNLSINESILHIKQRGSRSMDALELIFLNKNREDGWSQHRPLLKENLKRIEVFQKENKP